MMSEKYNPKRINQASNLLAQKIEIRQVSRELGIPETTLRNWKYNYSNFDGSNSKLNAVSEKQILNLYYDGYSIPKIAREIRINYDSVRLFFKKKLSLQDYDLLKTTNRKLPEKSKATSSELAYILGVMYGDGYFGKSQIRLGTKDKEFSELFCQKITDWCGKKPSEYLRQQNEKPYYDCFLSFKDATEFIKSIVTNRQNIPQIVLSGNAKEKIMFIRGFVDSEGTILLDKRWNRAQIRVYNQKINILQQIRTMLKEMGF